MRRLLTARLGMVVLAGVFVLTGMASAAHADQYILNIDHCTGTCGTPPFGTIDVVQNGVNDVKVTVTLKAGEVFANSAGGGVGFNLSGNPTISASNVTTGFALVSTTKGAIGFDGLGNFEYEIACTACSGGNPGNPAGPLNFDIIATGLTPAAFKEFSTHPPGDTDSYFGVDIRGTNANTGVVGTNTVTVVPEPGTLALVGTALIGVGAWARRRVRGLLRTA